MAVTGTTAGGGSAAASGGQTSRGWNGSLHPRAPKGQANGGKFTAGSGGSGGSSKSAAKPAAAPNGLGYTTAQWAQLQKLEAMAKAGKKLDAHQQHELHVAHQKKLAAMKAPAKKAPAKKATVKKTTAKKATVKKTAAKK